MSTETKRSLQLSLPLTDDEVARIKQDAREANSTDLGSYLRSQLFSGDTLEIPTATSAIPGSVITRSPSAKNGEAKAKRLRYRLSVQEQAKLKYMATMDGITSNAFVRLALKLDPVRV